MLLFVISKELLISYSFGTLLLLFCLYSVVWYPFAGSLEDLKDEQKQQQVEQFYNNAGEYAKANGITVSVLR